jgi:hypothetical protein
MAGLPSPAGGLRAARPLRASCSRQRSKVKAENTVPRKVDKPDVGEKRGKDEVMSFFKTMRERAGPYSSSYGSPQGTDTFGTRV